MNFLLLNSIKSRPEIFRISPNLMGFENFHHLNPTTFLLSGDWFLAATDSWQRKEGRPQETDVLATTSYCVIPTANYRENQIT
jgi:hypothetical protein